MDNTVSLCLIFCCSDLLYSLKSSYVTEFGQPLKFSSHVFQFQLYTTAHFVMHLLAFGINFLPHSVNLILIIFFSLFSIEFSKLFCLIITTVIVHHSYSFVFSTLNSKDTFSLNPSCYIPIHPFHRTAFTDTRLLNGLLFSFVSINLLVWFVQ